MGSDRRTFLLQMGAACGAVGISAALAGCSTVRYVPATEENKRLAVKKADLLDEKAVMVKGAHSKVPVYLKKTTEGDYLALLMLCSHKQCQVKPSGNFFVCPCHGSEFSPTGKVLKPPAAQDLRSYKVTEDSDHLYVHLN